MCDVWKEDRGNEAAEILLGDLSGPGIQKEAKGKMKKIIGSFVLACLLSGCSQAALDAGFKNLTSAQCQDPQAAVQNIPLMFLTSAQALQVVEAACTALYGTSPAPTTAPGQKSVL